MARVRNLVSWGVLAGLIVAGALIWNNRLALSDDFRLLGYTPPADIAAIADKMTLTNDGRRYFYASRPAIEGRTTFSKSCGNTEVHTTILGCYANSSIYIYDVTDTRLAGVEEVTAAHEMLHAAYARLTDAQRAPVDAMLQREYDTLSGDENFKERFSVYANLGTADRLNELHSIFATEIASLPSDLEAYYTKYFQNRQAIIGFYTAYQGPFNELKSQQAALSAEIDALKNETDTLKTTYADNRRQLNADIQAFNQRATSGGYTSQASYDADRAALEARSTALTELVATINAKIDRHNAAITQYNALTIQTRDLESSLDSQPADTVPTV